MPYALDNDAFICWQKNKEWDELKWLKMLEKVKMEKTKPLWVLIPDVVANREETIRKWEKYSPIVKKLKIKTAFACQDGMTEKDIPKDADVIFIGGTTEWKMKTIPMWTANHPRVHVGRVNTIKRILECERYGVESVDGSGWFRDTADGKRIKSLELWLEGKIKNHPEFNF